MQRRLGVSAQSKREEMAVTPIPASDSPDVLLICAGIMSATLAVLLKELDPKLKIELHEVLGSAAQDRL
jgi:malate dehydrogenase (quinone)